MHYGDNIAYCYLKSEILRSKALFSSRMSWVFKRLAYREVLILPTFLGHRSVYLRVACSAPAMGSSSKSAGTAFTLSCCAVRKLCI